MGTITCVCEFCEEFHNPSPKTNRILWEDDNFVVLPSIGSLTPGYTLLMPKRHVRSFADLPHDELISALAIVEQTRDVIEQAYGPVIVAEHGPGAPGARSSACCDHAHWHLIPSNPHAVTAGYEHAGGAPISLRTITDLRTWSGTSYLFLSPLKYVYFLWEQTDSFGSQFVRRVCARTYGIEDLYDWALFPFRENMLITKQRLAAPLRERLHRQDGVLVGSRDS